MKREQFIEKCGSDDFYFSDRTHVSCSMLKKALKSPKHLKDYLDKPSFTTPAMTFGSAFHCLLLEPEKFNNQFYILDLNQRPNKDMTMAAGVNKKWKESELSIAKDLGKSIISEADLDKLDLMIESVMQHDEIRQYLKESKREVPNAWEINGIKCKGKFDLLAFDYIADFKTTAELKGISKFGYDCKDHDYDMQAAFYCDSMGLDQFKFIVVSKKDPYNVAVYDASEEFLARGRAKYMEALDIYDKYFLSCDEEISSYLEKGTL